MRSAPQDPFTDLVYPSETPPPGGVMEIAPGIHWIRMPLPGRLDHVNLWILEDTSGWVLVDVGINNSVTAAVWDHVFNDILLNKPVNRIILTHCHVDHIGFVNQLVERTGAPVIMTMTEYFSAALRIFEPNERMTAQTVFALTRCGCPPQAMEAMLSRRKEVRSSYSGMPPFFLRAQDGDELEIGKRRWRLYTFGGHSPEMLCLFDPQNNVLIAGDQVLSQITPSINVHPADPFGNPLANFYESFPRLLKLPENTFVLPSHGRPFYGLWQRVGQFQQHHEERLSKILSFIDGSATPYELALKTFTHAMETHVARQALAETLAHLHFAERRGSVRSSTDSHGVVHFSRTDT